MRINTASFFGDLHAETVTPEKLAELEKAISKQKDIIT